jgi:hypothetical protein
MYTEKEHLLKDLRPNKEPTGGLHQPNVADTFKVEPVAQSGIYDTLISTSAEAQEVASDFAKCISTDEYNEALHMQTGYSHTAKQSEAGLPNHIRELVNMAKKVQKLEAAYRECCQMNTWTEESPGSWAHRKVDFDLLERDLLAARILYCKLIKEAP